MARKRPPYESKARKRLRVSLWVSLIAVMVLSLTGLDALMFARTRSLTKEIESLKEQNSALQASLVETKGELLAAQGDVAALELLIPTTGDLDAAPEDPPLQYEQDLSAQPDDTDTSEQGHRVYLTFDDGPSSSTDRILDILDEYGVKATFFVIGRTGDEAEAAYRRIVEEGHTLAMHSYTHQYSQIYASEEAYAADLSKLRSYLYDVTGVWPKYVRFPGGSSNTVSKLNMQVFIHYLDRENLKYFDWNVSSGDAASNGLLPPETIVSNCLSGIRARHTSIVLMHDNALKTTTVEALPLLLDALMEEPDTEILPIDDDTPTVQHVELRDDWEQ